MTEAEQIAVDPVAEPASLRHFVRAPKAKVPDVSVP
jgi:hypothetical protein